MKIKDRISLVIISILLAGILTGFSAWCVYASEIPFPKWLITQEAQSPEEGSTTPAASISAPQNAHGIKVPIIVYHIVRPAYPSDSAAVKQFAVTPEVFDAQLAYLEASGYHVVPLTALADYFYRGTPLPARPVVLNFDDAWEDQYVYAFPILQKYNLTATFFVPANFPGNPGFITWNQLREMIKGGMSIASHSRSHPYLTKITSTSTLWSEIYDSKQILAQKLGTTTSAFDYPFGSYDPAIVKMVQDAGYALARTDAFGMYQSFGSRYTLSAINAPTNLAALEKYFPAR